MKGESETEKTPSLTEGYPSRCSSARRCMKVERNSVKPFIGSGPSDPGTKNFTIQALRKVKHIEEGFPWTDGLDHTFKRVKRALERDVGPSRKAMEVKESDLLHKPFLKKSGASLLLCAHDVFLFAMTWMLRACELVRVEWEQLSFDHGSKTVSLWWDKAKGDQKASGTKRTLSCRCQRLTCDPLCPYAICSRLSRKPSELETRASHFAWSRHGRVKDKNIVVKAWKAVFEGAILRGAPAPCATSGAAGLFPKWPIWAGGSRMSSTSTQRRP